MLWAREVERPRCSDLERSVTATTEKIISWVLLDKKKLVSKRILLSLVYAAPNCLLCESQTTVKKLRNKKLRVKLGENQVKFGAVM